MDGNESECFETGREKRKKRRRDEILRGRDGKCGI